MDKAILFPLLLCLCLPALAQEPTAARLARADREPQNWLTYGGNNQAWRYSALDQITRANVARLKPVWSFETGEARGGLNATPLVMDGVLYLVGPFNRVFALNAATGEKLWSYFYQLPKMTIPYQRPKKAPCFQRGDEFGMARRLGAAQSPLANHV